MEKATTSWSVEWRPRIPCVTSFPASSSTSRTKEGALNGCASLDEKSKGGEDEIGENEEEEEEGPGSRRGHSTCEVGRCLVVFGGARAAAPATAKGSTTSSSSSSSTPLAALASSDVWVLDTSPRSWRREHLMQQQHHHHHHHDRHRQWCPGPAPERAATTAVRANEEEEARDKTPPSSSTSDCFGGGSKGLEGSSCAALWFRPALKPDSAAAPSPRKGHSARMLGGAVVVSGGYDDRGSRYNDKDGYELTFT